MGYRSDVMALIYPGESTEHSSRTDLYERLKTLMNTAFKGVMDEWGGEAQWSDLKLVLKFSINDVKWYPGYSSVELFTNFMNDVQDLGYETEFVRIGEETEDVEQRFSADAVYHLQVVRSIECEV